MPFTISDGIPTPTNVSLDTDKKILQWSHVLQPSDLPPEFELVHNGISYRVHMYSKDDIDTVISVPGGRNYLDIDDKSIVRIGCEELEFVVQTIINSRLGGNSTAVSGNFYVGKNNGKIHICMHDYSV